eukprot:c25648_g1_i1 orf=404-2404(-)
MASADELLAIEKAKVLMVGAGGIGCELLKTLVLTGFKDIHVIDLDTIEVSNLNRQFLFRQRHVGQSKAKVAQEAVLKFKPDVNIVAYHANVKNAEFNVDFFKQFHVVLNGLDNLDARRHVNRLCLAAGVPLIESGTTGYLGQVTVHVKGRTECYECQPKPAPKTYPVCTITSTPSKPVHCIVWAKELLFAKLFGDRSQMNDLILHSRDPTTLSEKDSNVFELQNGECCNSYVQRIFDGVFGHNIEVALKNEGSLKTRKKPSPLYLSDILPKEYSEDYRKSNGNFNHTSGHAISAMAVLGLKNPQETWSLRDNARVFCEAMQLFLKNRKKEIGVCIFDKDDQLAVEFVTAAANLRAFSFGIPMQSLFEVRGMAGNIVHAIATTNAIISGLIVLEAMKLLNNSLDSCRMTYCLEYPSRKMLLMPVEPFEPNPKCYVCSQTPLYLEVNTLKAKLRDVVEKIVKNKLSVNSPIIMHGSNLIFEMGEDLEEDMAVHYSANLDKALASFPMPIVDGSVLAIEDLQQEFSCSLHVKHRETFDEEREPYNMVLSGELPTMAPEEQALQNTLHTKNGREPSGVLQPVDAEEVSYTNDVIMVGVAKTGTKRKFENIIPEAELSRLAQSEDVFEAASSDGVTLIEEASMVGTKRKLESTATGNSCFVEKKSKQKISQ